MWPVLLDMTEEESIQSLRHLELEAYSSLVSALRAQGSLSHDKRRILRETGTLLNISNERHKAEVRRAISDEKLNTIAYHITGRISSLEDWAQEGRRLVPLLPRTPPQTTYSAIADEASEAASQSNKQLPFPASTERKRQLPHMAPSVPIPAEPPISKSSTFRIPEVPKEEPKKRKYHSISESSTLAQHLMEPKLSKIQQIYRQATKNRKQKLKDTSTEPENTNVIKPPQVSTPPVQQTPVLPTPSNAPKINVLQNITIPYSKEDAPMIPAIPEEAKSYVSPIMASENPTLPVSRALNIKQNNVHLAAPQKLHQPDTDGPVDPAKFNIARQTINKGQKLIVVSNSQTLPTNSILQKTLSVPINKLTKFKMDKFKIVPNSQLPSSLQVTQNSTVNKPRMVTIKGSTGKKVIPLSQLQMLHPKGNLKVVSYSGTLPSQNISHSQAHVQVTTVAENNVGKPTFTVAPVAKKVEECNSIVGACKSAIETEKVRTEFINGLNGGKYGDEYESKADEYRISEIHSKDAVEKCESFSSGSSTESDDRTSNGDSNSESMDNYEFNEPPHQDAAVLEEFEVIHTEELLQ